MSNLPEFRAMKFFIFGVNFAMFLTARLVARGLLRALFRLVPKHLLKFQLLQTFCSNSRSITSWAFFLTLLFFISTKGQLISKSLFGVFNFLQKTNENKSHSRKIEFFRSFFGGNLWLEKSFRLCLTFSKNGKS